MDGASFLSIVEEATKFGFGSTGHDIHNMLLIAWTVPLRSGAGLLS
jgi:hypothetical protein